MIRSYEGAFIGYKKRLGTNALPYILTVFSSLHVLVLMFILFPPCLHPQPSLPEEDYPPEDYPAAEQDAHNELLATGPPTLPKEFALSHGSNTIIPRACLDRSTPTGWNLTVEHNGTWVFTSEHSPEQVAPLTDL